MNKATQKIKHERFFKSGFSLIEILMATVILVVAVTGLIQLFIYCSILSEESRNLAQAMTEAQSTFEKISNDNYSAIITDYAAGGTPGNKFDLSQGNGKGVIYIDSSNPDLLKIEIVVSWRNQNGRIIGEDTNLNGILDGAEDSNGNGKLDSPGTFISWIAKR